MNTIGATREVMFEGTPFEGGYNKEFHYMGNQMVCLGRLFKGHLGIKVGTTTPDDEIEYGMINLKLGVSGIVRETGTFHLMIG